MQNAAISAIGLNNEFRYDLYPLPENELSTLVESIRVGTLTGANITIPYKTKIIQHINAVSDEAQKVGSVNTLYKNRNEVVGHNTDVQGFIEALREHDVNTHGSCATILGAGGAALAVAHGLAKEGISKLQILNRTLARAQHLANAIDRQWSLQVHAGGFPSTENLLEKTDILVNCTPIGMRYHSSTESPISKTTLHRDLVVMDLVYNPLRTRLLQDAQDTGCQTIDGISMLVHQGSLSLEIWTGQKGPVEVMREAVRNALVRWTE